MSQQRVLVVDDEANTRRVLEIMLQKMGHETRAAGNGQEALALAQTREVSSAVHWLHDRGAQNLVLVDGDQSLTFSNGKGMHTVPIPRIRRVLYSGSVECLVSWTAIALLGKHC